MSRFLTSLIVAVAFSSAGLSWSAVQPKPGAPAADAAKEKEKEKAKAKPDEAARKPDGSGEVRAVTRAILDEIDKHSQLMANLEYLCDMIGPRLTGSPGLTKASNWTLEKFKQYGLSNAHLEPWKINRGWTRGIAQGRIVSPTEQRLLLESAGWSISTPGNGPVRGPVVSLATDNLQELAAFKGKLKGAWIIRGAAAEQPSPKKPTVTGPGVARTSAEAKKFLADEGAAGILRDSDKEHGLVNMTSASYNFTPSVLPEAFLTTESYGLIWRLLQRGPVEIEIELKNTFSPGEVEVFNTVAEIPGSEKPDEVVIIGGHIDSWDLGTGATDNGTGIMAVLEAARALKAVGITPRRTIRFVLFSGEEEGLHGSAEYVKAHEADAAKISAVLVHDMGTGRVTSIGLQGRYDLREIMDRVVEPFKDATRLDELSLRNMGGTDHLSFVPKGVPAFAVMQDGAEYRKTHHTESDTFDKVYADEVNQGAKVLAAWAYNVAMLPDILPRSPKAAPPSRFDSPEFKQPKDQAKEKEKAKDAPKADAPKADAKGK